jgi:DNA-3-methyladenine glycosylase
MFGPKGHAYIYVIYGMYYCMNVVTGRLAHPQAILIRALEPIEGIYLMRKRLFAPDAALSSLCRGPGKLCTAMGITNHLYGADLTSKKLFLVPERLGQGEKVVQSVRINIAYAEAYVEKRWRYYLRGNAAVSGPAKLRE